MSDAAIADGLPLRQGSPAERDALQGLFARAAFTESALCERLKLRHIYDIDRRASRLRLVTFDATDPQAVLIRLFVLGGPVEPEVFDEVFDPTERAALTATDLVRRGKLDDRDYVGSAVRLVPIALPGGAHTLAADRELGIEGTRMPLPIDVVFPPFSFLTRQFLTVLPTGTTGAVLDLCTGAGVAALVSGSNARRVAAVDLTARAAHFAAFNAWLNGAAQLAIHQGDLYAPLDGERFDLIVAHPPYVPTFRQTAIFRDGGELGDVVVRGIIQGLPAHLEVGGTLYMVCTGLDTAEGRFEERVRAWMGEAGAAFDIVFAMTAPRSVEDFAATLAEGAINPPPDEEERRMALFRAHGVSSVVHGALAARRLPAGVTGETHRVRLDPTSTSASFDWLFRWIEKGRAPGFTDRILASTPRLLEGMTLDVGNVVQQGELVPRSFRLGNCGKPFPVQIEAEPWVVRLVMSLDGQITVAEAVERLRAAGHVPEQMTKADADNVVRYLAERGIIDVDLSA